MTLLFGDPGKDGVIPTQKSVAIRALNQPLLLSYIYSDTLLRLGVVMNLLVLKMVM